MSPPFDGAPGMGPDGLSDSFLQHQYQVLGIAELLSRPDVTEICINRPGGVYLETRSGWQ